MGVFEYERLETWQKAKRLVIDVYKLSNNFPSSELYGLTSQINRAAISVPSNIAEGVSRESKKELTHFLDIAHGSLMELACQLDICQELEYISPHDYKKIRNEILVLKKMIVKLKAYYKQ